MSEPCRIEMLGRLRVLQGDRAITRFRTRKTGALLAFLAYYAGRPHPREALIERYWPSLDARSGRENLRTALASLRRQIEPPGVDPGSVIEADRFTIQFRPGAVAIDVARFEALCREPLCLDRLIAAADLYHGELLPGDDDDWVHPERQRLATLFARVINCLVPMLAAADPERALSVACRAVTLDPFWEEGHAHVIRLLVAAGRPAEAARHHRQWEARLAGELGREPHLATRALFESLARPPARRSPRPEPISPPQGSPSGAAPPSSLPTPFTRFFGRDEEISQLVALLHGEDRAPRPRLVTLTGLGGSGKSRLALEVAHRVADAFAGGAAFCPLAEIDDSGRLPIAFRDALRLPPTPHLDPLDQIAAAFAGRPLLLLLDNVEHLLPAGADRVLALLERLPEATALVTSRVRLSLPGEREFPVRPLPMPASPAALGSAIDRAGVPAPATGPRVRGRGSEHALWALGQGARQTASVTASQDRCPEPRAQSPERLIAFPAVQLFLDRAQAVRPDFQLTVGNAAAVAALVGRLEGVPLAIELAAARAGVLSPAQMLLQLAGAASASPLLVSRARGVLLRHTSLAVALSWSIDALSPPARRFLGALSVFRGGWTLESATAVYGSGDETTALLEELRERSLILPAEGEDAELRFRMPELVREGAAALPDEPEREGWVRRHAAHFLALAEVAVQTLSDPNGGEQQDRLEREHENALAAIEWAARTAEAGDAEAVDLALRLAACLYPCWMMRGRWREARDRLERVLAVPAIRARQSAPLAAVLRWAGEVALQMGDWETARSRHAESMALARDLADPAALAWSLHGLGDTAHARSDHGAARAHFEESLEIAREIGELALSGLVLRALARLARDEGDTARARQLADLSLGACRSGGDERGVRLTLDFMGEMAYFTGDVTSARALLTESLGLARRFENRQSVAWVLNLLGDVARCLDEYGEAGARYRESLDLYRRLGAPGAVAGTLGGLGYTLQHRGDAAGGASCFAEALAMHRSAGNRRGQALCLEGLAGTAVRAGRPEVAARLFGAAEELRQALGGVPMWPAHRVDYERNLASLRAALPAATLAAAWAAGRALPTDTALALAIEIAVGETEGRIGQD
jgi:predicted ATPase/DNA-binding SARP family transcriptional activator